MIKIVSKQTVNGETDKINIETLGSYVEKGDKKFILYKEYDISQPKKHITSIVKIENENLIELIRYGKHITRFTLEKNKRHHCQYGTEFGPILMGVFTENIRINLQDTCGNIYIKYSIDLNSNLVSTNEINIKIKKIGE